MRYNDTVAPANEERLPVASRQHEDRQHPIRPIAYDLRRSRAKISDRRRLRPHMLEALIRIQIELFEIAVENF